MSRPLEILVCSTPIADHVEPAVPVAASLIARGHHVRWYTGREFRPAGARRFDLQHRCLDAAPHQLADLRRMDDNVRFDVALVDTDFTAGLMWEQLSGMPFATYGVPTTPTPPRWFDPARRALQRHHNEVRVHVGLPASPVTVFDAAISPYLHLEVTAASIEVPRRALPTHVHFAGPELACDLIEQLGATQRKVVRPESSPARIAAPVG